VAVGGRLVVLQNGAPQMVVQTYLVAVVEQIAQDVVVAVPTSLAEAGRIVEEPVEAVGMTVEASGN